MKVVSNTSPICYLWMINEVHLLPALFDKILIPEAVRNELIDKGAPNALRKWIKKPPRWLQIESVKGKFDPLLNRLHSGEREAIMLSHLHSADLTLLDEKEARLIAIDCGLNIAGLLGILDEAASQGIVDLPKAVESLCHTNFRYRVKQRLLLDKYLI